MRGDDSILVRFFYRPQDVNEPFERLMGAVHPKKVQLKSNIVMNEKSSNCFDSYKGGEIPARFRGEARAPFICRKSSKLTVTFFKLGRNL
jgi:hypothetical protein